VYFNNPDLPETRSEIALPLKSRNKVIGVLDVQSQHAEAFDDDDIAILQTLADQIALAIENARLFEGSQEALEELESQYRQDAEYAWRRRLEGGELSFIYDRLGVKATTDITSFKAQFPPDGHTVELPIILRGQNLGRIALMREVDQADWSQDELETIKTTVNQLTLSLENARLLEELQNQAEREHLVAEFSTKLWASSDLNTIARTAIQELGRTLNVSDATIELQTYSDDQG
jgi:GAF domain-containing protein